MKLKIGFGNPTYQNAPQSIETLKSKLNWFWEIFGLENL